ncbi:MAG: hypothetical protein DRN25_06640 [Thermoplasmata archaeon]|nr:MAG: hypothetical protein DRN25_06640 [Thermoplasmata archaeon]
MEKLGIFVTTDKYFDHVVELAKSAKRANKEVEVFLTAQGVLNVKNPRFKELLDVANVSLCEVGYKRYVGEGLDKLEKEESPVEGLTYKDFATQGKNAEILTEVDRYVVF